MHKQGRKSAVVFLAIVLALSFSPEAWAISYGFYAISNNSGNANVVAGQLSFDVVDYGGGKVSFQFFNAGPLASSITDIYFDDGALLGIASISNGTGTSFASPATPPNLPGGNTISPPFVTTAGFSADSNPPTQPNGVNPGEDVTIIFNLQAGKTFQDVLGDLNDGDLRVGVHVQAIAPSGTSDSFVNDGAKVPEPGMLLLIGAGLIGLVGFARRKK